METPVKGSLTTAVNQRFAFKEFSETQLNNVDFKQKKDKLCSKLCARSLHEKKKQIGC